MMKAIKIINEIKKAKTPEQKLKLHKELKQYCYYSDLNYKRLVEYYQL